MSSVSRVPQTRTMDGDELSADDARTTLQHYGRLHLVKDSFVRFRYGDGFSHSRALALQLVLALIPLGIAFIGLSSTIRADSVAAGAARGAAADHSGQHRRAGPPDPGEGPGGHHRRRARAVDRTRLSPCSR